MFRGSRFQVRGEKPCASGCPDDVFLTMLQILGPNDTGFEVREPLARTFALSLERDEKTLSRAGRRMGGSGKERKRQGESRERQGESREKHLLAGMEAGKRGRDVGRETHREIVRIRRQYQ